MRKDPDLEAALDRWRDRSDHEYIRQEILLGIGTDLMGRVDELLNGIQSYADLAVEDPQDPACAALISAKEALFGVMKTFTAVPDVLLKFTPWEGPKSAMELDKEARRGRAAASQVAVSE
jgi:hypothetical protein